MGSYFGLLLLLCNGPQSPILISSSFFTVHI